MKAKLFIFNEELEILLTHKIKPSMHTGGYTLSAGVTKNKLFAMYMRLQSMRLKESGMCSHTPTVLVQLTELICNSLEDFLV